MRLEVSKKQVLDNIMRLKMNVLHLYKDSEPQKDREYIAVLNRLNGEIRFLNDENRMRTFKENSEWMNTKVVVNQKDSRLELLDHNKSMILPSSVDALAWDVVNEMLFVLNEKIRQIKCAGNDCIEKVLFDCIDEIDLNTNLKPLLSHLAWHGQITRQDAEKILFYQPVGSYLLRQADEVVISSVSNISDENKLCIEPFILSVVTQKGKVSEHLLLRTSKGWKGWVEYQDDPCLSDPIYRYFATLDDLISSIKEAKYPFSS